MFLPEDQHPAHGLLRSVVKDSNDPDTNVFVDSDGHANDNTPRFAGAQLVAPLDGGAWHMATLTARAGNNSKGCARAPGLRRLLLVSGLPVASVRLRLEV